MYKNDYHIRSCKAIFVGVYLVFFSVQVFLQFSSPYLGGNSITYNKQHTEHAVIKKHSNNVAIVKFRLNKHFQSESLASVIATFSIPPAVFIPSNNSFYRPDILPERITDYISYRGPPCSLS